MTTFTSESEPRAARALDSRRERPAQPPESMKERPQAPGTIGEAIACWAALQGDAPALLGPDGERITFAALNASIELIARDLAAAGIGPEDRVGLLVPPGMAGGQLVVGVACNCVLVPLNPAMTPYEVEDALHACGFRALIVPGWLESAAVLLSQLRGQLALLQLQVAADGFPRLALAPGESPLPAAPAVRDVALILKSSGTTGAPKLVPVTHRNLLEMAQRLGSPFWFGLGPQDRAACTLPLYYAAGLKTTLFVPLILGAGVGFPARGKAHAVADWMDALRPTYLSCSPATLKSMVEHGRTPAAGSGSLRFIMCASSYLPEELRHAAQSAFGVPVLEFYGLSEAGVMAANPVRPGAARPGTVGLPIPGELRIIRGDGAAAEPGEIGQIVIAGPTVTPGYLPGGSAAADAPGQEWLHTGDLGRIDAQGYLTIVGRLKEVINRGGEKVFPYEIEKTMLDHPAVLEAAAFGVPHPRLGENVVAAAVLKAGTNASAQDIRSFVDGRLAAFKVPARIELVAQLPRGDTGKVSRRQLAEAYAIATQEAVAPVELFQFELLAIWRRLLGASDIGIDDDFADKGGDSLLATDMLLEVEALTGRPFPSGELSPLTIRCIADVVASGMQAGRETLTQVKSGTGPALFFCHGDHVTRGIYAHRLAAFLPPDQPVYLLHCVPAQLEDASIEDIADAYLREVLRVARGTPVFVGGYCNGGLAAWHLAHLLRMHGVPVLGLLLVETPSLGAGPSMAGLATAVGAAGHVVPGRTGRRLAQEAMGYAWRIARKGWRQSAQLALARGAAAVPGWRGAALPRAAVSPGPSRATTLSLRIMASYVPARLDVPVTCFIADNGDQENTDVRRWRRCASEVREVRTPGTHHTAVVAYRAELGAAISSTLRPERAPTSQMAAFTAELGRRTGRTFDGYDALHAFSVAEFRTFWKFLFDWCAGPLGFSGAPEPVCVGGEVEHARFFPSLQFNYADALLNLTVAPADAPALRERHADGTGRCWTRGELRDQAARLAVALRAAGVRPGDHVVAVMRNDARAVVAALAVTGLGATLSSASPDMGVQALLDRFEPLDPRLLLCHLAPQPTDVGPALAARVAGLAAGLPGLATVVSLDGTRFQGDSRLEVRTFDELLECGHAASFDWPRFAFNHPLFIMFSSGTTGRPKCIVHGAGGTLLEHVKEHRLHTDLRPGERMYFHTSCGWMMWNWQLSALASGVEIVTYDGPVDPVDRLWQLAAHEQVAVFGTSPAYLKMSQDAGLEPARLGLGRLRAVLSTGAVLHDAQFDWVERHVKPVPVQSISGGTDIIGCFVLGHPDLPVRRGEAQCRSLGLDVQAWRDGRSMAGVGDLVCATPFPSRPLGFHRDEDGARFHKAYFSQNPGVWTHGDLIEFSAAGGARLHGRSDGVLNVRGIKISPAEIYRVLDGIPGIREAMVVQQDLRGQGAHPPSGSQVVALLVLQEGMSLGHELAARIRRELAERLSAAHVPDRIIDVPALPVTHSGKPSEAAARAAASDRDAENAGALRNPDCLEAIRRHPGLRDVATPNDAAGGGPARPMTEQLCAIWESVLGTGPVGPDMNFFELGGSSLLAVMMLHQVRELTGKSLPLAVLVRAPTAARLAALLEQDLDTLNTPQVVQIREGTGRPAFLVHGLSGTVMECWSLVAALQTPRPIWGLQARGIDGEDEPLRSVEELAHSYVEQVLAVQRAGPYSICGFSFGGLVAYEMARQLVQAGHEVELVCLLDTYIDARLGAPALGALRVAQVARTLAQTPLSKLRHVLAGKLRDARADFRWRRQRGRWRSASEKLGLQPAQQRVYDAMEAALAQYRPAPYDGRVLLLRAQPPLDRYFGSLAQWRRVAARLSVVEVPGAHLDLVGRCAPAVAAHLDAALRQELTAAADAAVQRGAQAAAGGTSTSAPAHRLAGIHHSTRPTSCPDSRN